MLFRNLCSHTPRGADDADDDLRKHFVRPEQGINAHFFDAPVYDFNHFRTDGLDAFTGRSAEALNR